MLDAALGDRYVSEFFGLRPDVLLTLYVERGLWDRFLSRAAMGDEVGVIEGGWRERRSAEPIDFRIRGGPPRIHLSGTPAHRPDVSVK